jgi:UPF0176 protein
MAALHNRVSRKELKERLSKDQTLRTTISFYNYFFIEDPKLFRDEMFRQLQILGVFGRIYIAHEGINAQVSVPTENVSAFRDHLYSIERCRDIRLNIAVDDSGKSFYVLDIKVRKNIVADGISDPSFDMRNKGRYVNAAEFNLLTTDPQTVIIDMRNHYEFEVGHFKEAIEVPSDTFRQQLPMAVEMMQEDKNRNIIMYCTGGIRCEKASAYMLHHGFSNVFHLEGGIINYTREVREKGIENKFIGKNFVFDERLGERITEDIIATCHQCGEPCDTHVNCKSDACHLLFIQCPQCAAAFEECCSEECRAFIHLPEEQQKEFRRGIDKGQNIFNKSRRRKSTKASSISGTQD